MNALKRFATRSPVAFGVLAAAMLWVLYIAAAVVAAIASTDAISTQAIEAAGVTRFGRAGS